MSKWLRDKLITLAVRLRPLEISGVFMPVYLDRIMIRCPECDKGGMWAVPDGFRVAVAGRLLVICPYGHNWSISGAWTEEKNKDNDN